MDCAIRNVSEWQQRVRKDTARYSRRYRLRSRCRSRVLVNKIDVEGLGLGIIRESKYAGEIWPPYIITQFDLDHILKQLLASLYDILNHQCRTSFEKINPFGTGFDFVKDLVCKNQIGFQKG